MNSKFLDNIYIKISVSYIVLLFFLQNYSYKINGRFSILHSVNNWNYINIFLFIFIFFAYDKFIYYFKVDKKSLIFSSIFSIFINISINSHYFDMLLPGTYSLSAQVVFFTRIVVLSFITNIILNFINSNINSNISKYNFHIQEENNYKYKILFLTIITRIFPVVIYFPNVITWDLLYQILMGIGVLPLTDEHPWFITVIMGQIIKIGKLLFGNFNAGITLYSFLFLTVNILLTYKLQIYIFEKTSNKFMRFFSVIFYNFNFILLFFNIITWKDNILAIITPFFIILSYELFTDTIEFFENKRKVFKYITIVFVFVASKLVALPSIIFCSIFLLFMKHKDFRLKAFFITIFPLIIFIFGNSFLINQFGILSGKKYDKLSLPIQQIVRTLKKHEFDLKIEDKKFISKVLPVEKVINDYDPWISDPVKELFNYKVYENNKSEYNKFWIRLGIKHPITYLEAFFSNSYKYLLPINRNFLSNSTYLHWISCKNEIYEYIEYQLKRKIDKIELDNYEYNFKNLDNSTRKINFAKKLLEYLFEIPILGLFLNIGFYSIMYFVGAFIIFKRKEYSKIILYLTIFGLYLCCVFSPVNGEMRYAYGMIYSFPIVLYLTLESTDKSYVLA